jgi:hypothetical protein
LKYIANPVEVDAFKILSMGPKCMIEGQIDAIMLAIDNGESVIATAEMTSRMTPKPGDYWVIQSDGYIYLNPKEVFERKYHPKALAENA